MAEALAQRVLGRSVYIASAGARSGQPNPFTLAILAEVGIDWSRHRPKTLEDLGDDGFDLIVTLSPEAHHRVLDVTRRLSVEVSYWPTVDPTAVEGSRDAVMAAFRMVREGLATRIGTRFGVQAVDPR